MLLHILLSWRLFRIVFYSANFSSANFHVTGTDNIEKKKKFYKLCDIL